MKPDFALNFTDTSIALLHRTAKGWLKVGETPFDAADLEDALDYMRKTALGLAPGGFTTKLVIPASQILYTEVDISGGDEERTRREILNALEARTPYKADEIAWDWTRGEGRTAKVAAVARETLAEAESFAITHKFSPVSFVAIPPIDEAGNTGFPAEPWFGETSDARNFLAADDVLERDDSAIALIDEIRAAKRRAKAARDAVASHASDAGRAPQTAPPAESREASEAVDGQLPLPDPTPVRAEQGTEILAGQTTRTETGRWPGDDSAAGTGTGTAPGQSPAETGRASESPAVTGQQPESGPAENHGPTPEPASSRSPEQGRPAAPATTSLPEQDHKSVSGFDGPAPFRSASTADGADRRPGHIPAPTAAPAPSGTEKPGPRLAITEITPLGVAAEAVPAHAAMPAAGAAASRPPATATPSAPHPGAAPSAPISAAPASGNGARISLTAGTALPSAHAAPGLAPPGAADPDEAPFAHVSDMSSFPETDEAPDQPPLPHLARRMAGLPPLPGQAAAPPARPMDAPPQTAAAAFRPEPQPQSQPQSQPPVRPAAPAQGAAWTAGDDQDSDLPPSPSPAVLLANGRSNRVHRPLAAPGAQTNGQTGSQPAPALPATGDLPPAHRAPVFDEAAPVSPAPRRAAAGITAMVTAPSIPGIRPDKRKPKPLPARAPQPRDSAGETDAAASSLARSPFAAKSGRGKPRFLGLILTAILLLCLALVAAWSSLYLSSIRETPEESQFAASGDEVSTDDEMLADGIEPEAAPTGSVETAEPAPGTALDSQSPSAVALLGNDDEIFLSGSDAPPPAFDALSLPGPDATAEAPPGEPMPPPPFGTVYRFDENGLLLPTAAGLPAPGGYMLFEGKPPRVPPVRSSAAEAAAAAARAAAAPQAPADTTPAGAAAGTGTDATGGSQTASDADPGNPSLVPGADGIAAVTAEDSAQIAAPVATEPVPAAAPTPAAQPNPELADRRPRARPDRAGPDEDAALAQPDEAVSEFAGLRPRARPALVEAAGARARANTATASLANEAEIQLASAPVASVSELSASEAANPSIMTISRRPANRPKDFSRAVEAAVAAAVRAPDPAPAPTETAAASPAPAAPKASGKSAAKPDEQDEIDEPEVASAPAPKIPTKASVAKQATFTKAINLSKVNLIGVYGTQSNRHALVRLANGKYRKVKVGEKIDGGQVKAITQSEVRYQKGGRLIALTMPKS